MLIKPQDLNEIYDGARSDMKNLASRKTEECSCDR